MKKTIAISFIAAFLLWANHAQADEYGRHTFFDAYDVASSAWCYEDSCNTSNDTTGLYATRGQLYVGNYTQRSVIIRIRTLASTSLTVRIEGRADIGTSQTDLNAYVWSNIWTKTYTATTQGLSGSDIIGEVVQVSEYWPYIRVGTLVTSNVAGDVLTVHGAFKQR